MRLADVNTVIEPGVDPDKTYAAFQAETGDVAPEKFLSYLKRKELVSDAQFVALHANDAIEVTAALTSIPAGPHGPARSAGEPRAAHRARYELIGDVGRGGMGLVHLARDVDLRRKVAFKELGPDAAANTDALARFVKEVQITAQLDHPHIVPVYSLEPGEAGGLGYAMKLVQGKTFADYVAETRGALERGEALDQEHELHGRLERFLNVCDAVAYAHEKGVLHRDLKPANLMLGRFHEVYVMDWGLARLIGRPGGEAGGIDLGAVEAGDSRVTETRLGTVVGTPRYMSPEQVTEPSDALDGRSDEYALGLILFELVTLGPAVPGETITEVVRAAMEARKAPMVAAVPGAEVPRELVAIVEKATARRREDRYATVADLAGDVRRYLRDEEILARPDTRTQKLMRLMARHRRATLAGVAALVVLSALGFLVFAWRRQAAEEEARLREARTDRFVADVSRNGEAIDAHFLQLQGLLQGLAGAAEHALLFGARSSEPYATAEDFRDPKRRPADAFVSKRYGGWVSAEFPLWSLPKGAGAAAQDQLHRLVPLRRMRRRLFLESQGRAATKDEDFPSRALLDAPEMPLVWTLIGLPSGLSSVYPGSSLVPPGYDPRGRPWYRLAEKAGGPVWGAPHRDLFGTGLVLSCSVPLHDERGRFLGAAAVDLAFDRVARSMLSLTGHPGVEECFLLDGAGGVLVRSRRSAGATFDEKGDVKVERFRYFNAMRPATAVSGTALVGAAEKTRLVVWRRLESLGLTYAVVADRDVVARGGTDEVKRRFFRRKRS